MLSSIDLLSGCSSISGNVVPQEGLTMEQVYDDVAKENKKNVLPCERPTNLKNNVTANSVEPSFHRLPNPELKMYVYPHFAEKNEVPIPGYYTMFNAYDHGHYVLSNEMVREN